jgi:hypothetical protein
MKICVLTYPRTSSTNLLYTLKELTGIDKVISEPFNQHMWNGKYRKSFDFVDSNEIIIKDMFLWEHKPSRFETMNDLLDWYLTNFDKIILLYRENTRLQSESFLYHMQFGNLYGWHTKKYYQIEIITKEKIIEYQNKIIEWNKILKDIATKHNLPIFKYENLIEDNGNNDFFKEICKYIGCEFNTEIISKRYNKNQKYRLETPIKNSKLI